MTHLPANIDDLEKLGYRLDEELTHADLVPFVVRYLKTSTVSSRFFFAFNIGAAFLLLSVCIYAIGYQSTSLGAVFLQFSYGCAITLLLVPIHEGLHGLAYKLCGAPSVTYEAHWRKLYFTANADKFVVNRKSFMFVGLAPFVVITCILAIAAGISPLPQTIMFLTTLTVHAGMCAGDFGLLSYFDYKKPLEVITYDDMKAGKSFFLVNTSEAA